MISPNRHVSVSPFGKGPPFSQSRRVTINHQGEELFQRCNISTNIIVLEMTFAVKQKLLPSFSSIYVEIEGHARRRILTKSIKEKRKYLSALIEDDHYMNHSHDSLWESYIRDARASPTNILFLIKFFGGNIINKISVLRYKTYRENFASPKCPWFPGNILFLIFMYCPISSILIIMSYLKPERCNKKSNACGFSAMAACTCW